MQDFNSTGRSDLGLFGLGSTFEEAETGILTVPWDVTSSYRAGSSESPQKLINASSQFDLYHPDFAEFPTEGIFAYPVDMNIISKNSECRAAAKRVITAHETGAFNASEERFKNDLNIVNKGSSWLNDRIYAQAESFVSDNKLIGLIGGDHSTSYPLINVLSDYIDSFTVLQIDAHMDLRTCYQGFNFSHASVMHNSLALKSLKRLVQVGVRDYCAAEHQVVLESKGRIKTFYDQQLKADMFQGKSWDSLCKKIVNNCTDNVYITIDVDGLMPQYCPHTGTPVMGGLDVAQVVYLVKQLVKSKRRVIGFDMVEVNGPAHGVDVVMGIQLFYQVAGYAWLSHQEYG